MLWEADALLALVPQLRATGVVTDLGRLREKLGALLRDFQARALRNGVEAARVAQASEVLAALIDHIVTSMPWGAEAGWRSLGASSAPALERGALDALPRLLALARTAASDAGIRELIAVALALGFDGAGEHGASRVQIDELRAELTAAKTQSGVAASRELSPQWRDSVERGSALAGWLPLWVSSLVLAGALAVLYLALQFSLAARSDRLYERLLALGTPAAASVRPLPAPQPRLAAALSRQMAAHELVVRDEIDRSVIVVPGSQLFEPGGATLRAGSAELLQAITAALQRTPGRIELIGHTGQGEARAARYASDWDLSVDRARAVEEALRAFGIGPSRLRYDGRGGIEPAAADGTPCGEGCLEIRLLAGR